MQYLFNFCNNKPGFENEALIQTNLYFEFNLVFKDQFNYFKAKHSYHLVDPSPWPFLASVGGFMFTTGLVLYMHKFTGGWLLLLTGLILIICVLHTWWRDVIREAFFEDQCTKTVQKGLRLGTILFIVFEIMVFFAFFILYYKTGNYMFMQGCLLTLISIPFINPFKKKNIKVKAIRPKKKPQKFYFRDLIMLVICILQAMLFLKVPEIAFFAVPFVNYYQCINYFNVISVAGVLLTTLRYAMEKPKPDYDWEDLKDIPPLHLEEIPWVIFFYLSLFLLGLGHYGLDHHLNLTGESYIFFYVKGTTPFPFQIPGVGSILWGDFISAVCYIWYYYGAIHLLFFKHPPQDAKQVIEFCLAFLSIYLFLI
jgi:Cytochrome c oxidase subunit III